MQTSLNITLLLIRHQKLIGILNMIGQSQRRQETKQQLLTGVWGRLIADYRAKRKVHAEILFQKQVTERLQRYYEKQLNQLSDKGREQGTGDEGNTGLNIFCQTPDCIPF
jgi:hypothetical protein